MFGFNLLKIEPIDICDHFVRLPSLSNSLDLIYIKVDFSDRTHYFAARPYNGDKDTIYIPRGLIQSLGLQIGSFIRPFQLRQISPCIRALLTIIPDDHHNSQKFSLESVLKENLLSQSRIIYNNVTLPFFNNGIRIFSIKVCHYIPEEECALLTQGTEIHLNESTYPMNHGSTTIYKTFRDIFPKWLIPSNEECVVDSSKNNIENKISIRAFPLKNFFKVYSYHDKNLLNTVYVNAEGLDEHLRIAKLIKIISPSEKKASEKKKRIRNATGKPFDAIGAHEEDIFFSTLVLVKPLYSIPKEAIIVCDSLRQSMDLCIGSKVLLRKVPLNSVDGYHHIVNNKLVLSPIETNRTDDIREHLKNYIDKYGTLVACRGTYLIFGNLHYLTAGHELVVINNVENPIIQVVNVNSRVTTTSGKLLPLRNVPSIEKKEIKDFIPWSKAFGEIESFIRYHFKDIEEQNSKSSSVLLLNSDSKQLESRDEIDSTIMSKPFSEVIISPSFCPFDKMNQSDDFSNKSSPNIKIPYSTAECALHLKHLPSQPSVPFLHLISPHGNGKSTLLNALLATLPYHVVTIQCNKTLLSRLKDDWLTSLHEALYFAPSILVLEDIDVLIFPQNMTQDLQGQEEYAAKVLIILKSLKKMAKGRIIVIITSSQELVMFKKPTSNSLNGNPNAGLLNENMELDGGLITLFDERIEMKRPNREERIIILKNLLKGYVENGILNPKYISFDNIEIDNSNINANQNENIKRNESSKEISNIVDKSSEKTLDTIQESFSSDQKILQRKSVISLDSGINKDEIIVEPLTIHDLKNISSGCEGYIFTHLVNLVSTAIHHQCVNSTSLFTSFSSVLPSFRSKMFPSLSYSLPTSSNIIGLPTFDCVGGYNDIKDILMTTLVLPLRYPILFKKLPLRPPKNILITGPPGCGKSLLISCLSSLNNYSIEKQIKNKESKAKSKSSIIPAPNIFYVRGPQLISKYIGASEQNLDDLFHQAYCASPSLIIFDHLESMVAKRGGNGKSDGLVNMMLALMDGVEKGSGNENFESNEDESAILSDDKNKLNQKHNRFDKNVFIVGVTSRMDLLDSALLRGGRFDKVVWMGLPNVNEREEILKIIAKNLLKHKLAKKSNEKIDVINAENILSEQIDWKQLAIKTEGFTGADLRGLLVDCIYKTGKIKDVWQSLKNARKSLNREQIEEYEIM